MSDLSSLPFVGQLVDYYPDNETRNAALVTEVHIQTETENRPKVNLAVFEADGSIAQAVDIEAVQDGDELADRWSFQQEYDLLGDHSEESPDTPFQGTKSNSHVNTVQRF